MGYEIVDWIQLFEKDVVKVLVNYFLISYATVSFYIGKLL